jgi:hypothetical protein
MGLTTHEALQNMFAGTHKPTELKKVGFWAGTSVEDRGYPYVEDLVDMSWGANNRDEWTTVVSHLEKKGMERAAYKGSSNCRICGRINGSTDLSDGVWVWPKGFVHYVIDHYVKPPQEFIDHCMKSRLAERLASRLDLFKLVGLGQTRDMHEKVRGIGDPVELRPGEIHYQLLFRGPKGDFSVGVSEESFKKFMEE